MGENIQTGPPWMVSSTNSFVHMSKTKSPPPLHLQVHPQHQPLPPAPVQELPLLTRTLPHHRKRSPSSFMTLPFPPPLTHHRTRTQTQECAAETCPRARTGTPSSSARSSNRSGTRKLLKGSSAPSSSAQREKPRGMSRWKVGSTS